MSDDVLDAIDDAFAARSAKRTAGHLRRSASSAPFIDHAELVDDVDDEAPLVEGYSASWYKTGWIEAFLAAQFLWGALLFIPGAQEYRGYIRALPYVASLGMLALYAMRLVRGPRPKGSSLMTGALLLLVLNLLHPNSQLSAGLAQCIFQLSIAAPLFWAHKAVRSPALVERLLILIFAMNALSAGLGVLQVYSPDRFMPSEFNSLGLQLNQYYVEGLTYTGSDDRTIIRPPGLTDQPGAAATAGALTAILGLGLLLRRRSPAQILGILGAIAVGFAAIYLSQVRSTLLATIGAGTILSLVSLRRGRFAGAGWILVTGGALVMASFIWAVSVGGNSVTNRFVGLQGSGAIEAYRSGRGGFVSQTIGELLDQYPLGAGVGRWGMMNTYFASQSEYRSTPIYVEIQLTGWLLDGGLLMWLLYGGATVSSLWSAFALTNAGNAELAEVAIIGLALQAYILGLVMGSPVFNTQMGILFWTVAGMLHGARHFGRNEAPQGSPGL